MKTCFLITLILICSTGLKAQPSGITFKIDSLIGTVVSKNSPGAVVGIARDGKVLYKKTYGMANLDYRIPVTDSTLFNLASVSKQFTAFLILRLEEEGKICLDDDIEKYIPEVKYPGQKISIRQLLHHTSGIPSSDNLRLFSGLPQETKWDTDDEFNLLNSYHKLNFIPNSEEAYSNTGYILLARFIEKVEGKPFSQCIKEQLFEPLKMKTAEIYDSQGKIILNRASGYKKSGNNYSEIYTKGESVCGSTNLYASVNDMINWSANMTTRSFGGNHLFDRLFIPSDTLNNGDTIKYTFGLFTGKYKSLAIVQHGGATTGFRSQINIIPAAHFSVFILSNNESTDTWDIASKITDLYLKDLVKPEPAIEHKEISVNKKLFNLYKGSYIIPEGIVFTFENINDTLKLIIPSAPKFVLYPEKEDEFFLKDFDAQCTFVKDTEGKINEMIWHQGGHDTKGVRYSPPVPLTQDELQSYTGKYEIPGLNAIYMIELKDNEIALKLPKAFSEVNIDPNLTLGHMTGDKFYGRLGNVQFNRNDKGAITGFVIEDIGRLKNIEFSKRN